MCKKLPQLAHLDGFDLVSNKELQETQELLDLEGIFGPEARDDRVLRIASFVFLMEKFLAFAWSLNRTRIKFFRNQTAALEESGMVELPCIWIVLVE